MSGKGDCPRGQSKEERKRFSDGWDAAFGDKAPAKPRAKRLKHYPHWVCIDCGHWVGRTTGVCGWHTNKCDVCGEWSAVTEARDWGYPDFPGFETRAKSDERWRKSLSKDERERLDTYAAIARAMRSGV